MMRTWNSLAIFAGSLVMATNTIAAPPRSPYAAPAETVVQAPASNEEANDAQVRPLLEKLNELSRLIERDAQSPQAWMHHMEQAEVLLQLAGHSKDKERETLLRSGVDAYYGAAVLSPQEQPAAFERFRQLPQRLAQAFPGSPVIHYALLQEIQADCLRVLEKSGGDNAKAQEHRGARLLQFARQHPDMPEAEKAVLEAAQISETLGKIEAAATCYRYLMEHSAGKPAGRKAEGALWRLGQNHEPVRLELPLLYSSGSSTEGAFNLDQFRGNLVVVYFWSSVSPQVEEDFQIMRQLTDRHLGRGVQVVYVNMDGEAAQGRAFLSGRLTAGVHLYQAGGMSGVIAERYGIQKVPQAFVIGKDGTLLRHSVPASRLEAEVAGSLQRGR